MKRIKFYSIILALILVLSAAVIPASAEATTFTISVNQTFAESDLSNYQYGNLQYTKNYSTSTDGVYIYIDYRDSYGNWVNTHTKLVEPGDIYGSTTNKYAGMSEQANAGFKTKWRGIMKSYWYNGTGIRADTRYHAHN